MGDLRKTPARGAFTLGLALVAAAAGPARGAEDCPPTLEIWAAARLPGGGAEVDLLRVRDGLGRFDRATILVDAPPADARDAWFVPALADAARRYRVERRTRPLHEADLEPFCAALAETGLAERTPEPGCRRLESMAATVLPTLRDVDLDEDRGIGFSSARIRPGGLPDCAAELEGDAGDSDPELRRIRGRAVVRQDVDPGLSGAERDRWLRSLEELLRDAAADWLDDAERSDGPVAAALLPTVRAALGEKPSAVLGFVEPPDFGLGLEGSPSWLKLARAAEALAGDGEDRDAALVTLSRIPAPELSFELRAELREASARGATARAVTALRALLLADPDAARAEARTILEAGEDPRTDAALGVFVWTEPALERRWAEAGPPAGDADRRELIEAARAAAASAAVER